MQKRVLSCQPVSFGAFARITTRSSHQQVIFLVIFNPRCRPAAMRPPSTASYASEGDAVNLDPTVHQVPSLMQPDVLYVSANSRMYRGWRLHSLMKTKVQNDPPFMTAGEELDAPISDSKPSSPSTSSKKEKEGR